MFLLLCKIRGRKGGGIGHRHSSCVPIFAPDNAVEEPAAGDYCIEEIRGLALYISAVEKCGQAGREGRIGPGLVDHPGEYLEFEQVLFVFFDDAEGRVYGEQVEVVGYGPLAKCVDGADVGGVECEQLAAKIVSAALLELCAEVFGDAGLHFAGGGICKGQDEYLRDIGRVG